MSFVSLWFLPLARQKECILEYILPTKPKRAGKGYRLYRYRPYLQELLEIESEADLQVILNVIALPERELRD